MHANFYQLRKHTNNHSHKMFHPVGYFYALTVFTLSSGGLLHTLNLFASNKLYYKIATDNLTKMNFINEDHESLLTIMTRGCVNS